MIDDRPRRAVDFANHICVGRIPNVVGSALSSGKSLKPNQQRLFETVRGVVAPPISRPARSEC